MRLTSRYTGFTLIELLIVISIIALLSLIGLVAYSSFLKTSRDNKRQSDLKIIQSALEDYHSDQFFYPGSMSFSATFSLTSVTGNPSPPTVVKTYLNNVSIGPTGLSEYQYQAYKWNASGTDYINCTDSDNLQTSTNKCIKYCLYAKMEGTAPTSDQGCNTNFPADGYNFGVNRP